MSAVSSELLGQRDAGSHNDDESAPQNLCAVFKYNVTVKSCWTTDISYLKFCIANFRSSNLNRSQLLRV